MFLLDQGYQHANGFLSHREPARLYHAGYFLLAIWAPALQPQDAADPRLAEIIRHGSEFGLRNISLRNTQLFGDGYLVVRWRHAEPDARKSNEIAVRTALHAFYRDPATVIGLAARTYFEFWSGRSIRKLAKAALGLDDEFYWPFYMSNHFRSLFATSIPESRPHLQTLTTWNYKAASPYFFPRAAFAAPLAGASVYCAEQGIRLATVCAHDSAAHEHIPALYWTGHEVSSPLIIPYAAESCASGEVIARLAQRGPK